MYLMTAYRLLENYYIGLASRPFQGLIQGNRVASLRFLLIAIMLMIGLYKADLIPPSSLSISKCIYHLAG